MSAITRMEKGGFRPDCQNNPLAGLRFYSNIPVEYVCVVHTDVPFEKIRETDQRIQAVYQITGADFYRNCTEKQQELFWI